MWTKRGRARRGQANCRRRALGAAGCAASLRELRVVDVVVMLARYLSGTQKIVRALRRAAPSLSDLPIPLEVREHKSSGGRTVAAAGTGSLIAKR